MSNENKDQDPLVRWSTQVKKSQKKQVKLYAALNEIDDQDVIMMAIDLFFKKNPIEK